MNIFDRSLHNEGRAIAQICGVCRERRRSGGTAGMPVARLGAVSIKGCRGAGQRVTWLYRMQRYLPNFELSVFSFGATPSDRRRRNPALPPDFSCVCDEALP